MVQAPHVHAVQVYYEDTDHSGVVYHANYLKYFERAREHFLGVSELVGLWETEGVGFVVYKAEMTFREGAVFGDALEIHTRVERESDYRLVFHQDVHRRADGKALGGRQGAAGVREPREEAGHAALMVLARLTGAPGETPRGPA
jgi:acyl-CoA thioester hydrolase